MTTIEKFIAYLQTLPTDTEISVVDVEDGGFSQYGTWVPLGDEFEYNEVVSFVDLSDERFKDSKQFGRKFLQLGSE